MMRGNKERKKEFSRNKEVKLEMIVARSFKMKNSWILNENIREWSRY